MPNSIDYYDGQWLAANDVRFPPSDLGLQRGFGVFETLRATGSLIFQAERHLARLRQSAQLIGLPYLWTDDVMHGIWTEGVAKNGFVETGLKVIITGGPSPFLEQAAGPVLFVQFRPHHRYPAALYEQGATLRTSPLLRELPEVKSLNYLSSVVAWRTAQAAGDHEALFVGRDQLVRECATANFFAVQAGTLITPAEGILLGTTRELVLELARATGLVVTEQPLPLPTALACQEAFITSVNRRIMPVVAIDGQPIGQRQIGSVSKHLMNEFSQFEAGYGRS